MALSQQLLLIGSHTLRFLPSGLISGYHGRRGDAESGKEEKAGEIKTRRSRTGLGWAELRVVIFSVWVGMGA